MGHAEAKETESLCGIHCTKFECISSKILIPTNRTRGARGGLKLHRSLRLHCDANQCASDTLADSRVQNPKHFLTFLISSTGSVGGAEKMERNFLVLLRRFSLRKEHYYFIIFDCSFLRPHGDRGAPVSAFCGNSNHREPHTTAYS